MARLFGSIDLGSASFLGDHATDASGSAGKSSYEDEEAREAAITAALQSHASTALEKVQQHPSWRQLLGSLREFAKVPLCFRCAPSVVLSRNVLLRLCLRQTVESTITSARAANFGSMPMGLGSQCVADLFVVMTPAPCQ